MTARPRGPIYLPLALVFPTHQFRKRVGLKVTLQGAGSVDDSIAQ